jgi:hypothetical protein
MTQIVILNYEEMAGEFLFKLWSFSEHKWVPGVAIALKVSYLEYRGRGGGGRKSNVPGEKAALARKAVNLTALCEPTV